MALSTSVAIILLSLSAIPVTYIVNTAHSFHGEQGLFWSGVGVLSTLTLITYFIVSRQGAPREPLYFGKSLYNTCINQTWGQVNSGIDYLKKMELELRIF